MKRLCDDLRGFNNRARVICVFVIALAMIVLTLSITRIIESSAQAQFMLIAFATIIAFLTGPRPVRLPGTKTVVSVSEAIIFLSAILLGPYHAATLGMVDAIGGSRKLA